jgi:hypothetical protein
VNTFELPGGREVPGLDEGSIWADLVVRVLEADDAS